MNKYYFCSANYLSNMKRLFLLLLLVLVITGTNAQSRRPIDSQHPLWLIHIDVWNKADPQKIIDLIPDDIKPYVCMNLSLSCQYDTEKNVYKMPQNAVRTYKSWASVCQMNGLWFTCQPASGGHTHIQDNDLETFEHFYKRYPNFLGWNYAEQFWGFDEPNDKSSSTQASRIALFAKLVPMAHKYGGFLTISFCGNIWSHPLNPMGMMKRNAELLQACKDYPDAILWLYKYTTSSCFYNNESMTYGPFISGLAKSYGVRYDNCGWNGALESILGKDNGKKYPVAAGIGTVMEQTAVNGGAVWDGPELIWTEDFQNLSDTNVDGYTRRNWGTFPGFRNAWLDMFHKIIDGTIYIPTREEVIDRTKIVVINDLSTGNDEQKYAAWGSLYDGLYKQDDPFNRNNGQWMDNYCYFKKTGRYAAIPIVIDLYDDLSKSIPVQVRKSAYTSRWSSQKEKVADFDNQYAEVSQGDLYVSRLKNQLVTYTPYTYLNTKTTASADIPLLYNTCERLQLTYGKLSSGLIRESADRIDFYLNNYRNDTTKLVVDRIVVTGVTSQPSYEMTKRVEANASATANYDAEAQTYTLEVSHNGAVDLTLHCTGNATDRQTDVLPMTSLSADLPKQPEDYHGEIIIEAEDMDFMGIKSCVTDPYGRYPNVRGHAGNGFADMGTSTSGALRHQLNVKHPGDYTITIRYTSPQTSGNLAIMINGARKLVSCEKTANNEWRKATFDATLSEGLNNLVIKNTSGLNMYIDQVIYAPEGLEEERFGVSIHQAEHGTVVADTDTAVEGQVVSLSVMPDEGYALSGWNIIHGGVSISDEGQFTMPDDNVTIEPVFTDMSAIYAIDYSNVLNGNFPEGWRAMQEDNVTHEYPNNYTSGDRTFVGFNGYQGKALYWRVNNCEYGRQSAYPLTLEKGSYKLTFAMAAWKGSPKYKARILSSTNVGVATTEALAATPNANGSTSANLSSSELHELPFEITESGKYIISFVNNGSGFDEFLLLECNIKSTGQTGIDETTDRDIRPMGIYSVAGVRRESLQPGLNIVVGRDGKARKMMVK